jgi:hypothetical protein
VTARPDQWIGFSVKFVTEEPAKPKWGYYFEQWRQLSETGTQNSIGETVDDHGHKPAA